MIRDTKSQSRVNLYRFHGDPFCIFFDRLFLFLTFLLTLRINILICWWSHFVTDDSSSLVQKYFTEKIKVNREQITISLWKRRLMLLSHELIKSWIRFICFFRLLCLSICTSSLLGFRIRVFIWGNYGIMSTSRILVTPGDTWIVLDSGSMDSTVFVTNGHWKHDVLFVWRTRENDPIFVTLLSSVFSRFTWV